MFKNIKVGDKVYIKRNRKIEELTVDKVGRKYFYHGKDQSCYSSFKFRISDGGKEKGCYYSEGMCYKTEQEIKYRDEYSKLNFKITKFFREENYKLDLEQFREIEKIVER